MLPCLSTCSGWVWDFYNIYYLYTRHWSWIIVLQSLYSSVKVYQELSFVKEALFMGQSVYVPVLTTELCTVNIMSQIQVVKMKSLILQNVVISLVGAWIHLMLWSSNALSNNRLHLAQWYMSKQCKPMCNPCAGLFRVNGLAQPAVHRLHTKPPHGNEQIATLYLFLFSCCGQYQKGFIFNWLSTGITTENDFIWPQILENAWIGCWKVINL